MFRLIPFAPNYRLICTLFGLFILSACFTNKESRLSKEFRFPMPSQNEVARVNDQSLTIADFINIRSSLQTHSNETALWVGIGALALETESRQKGKPLEPRKTLDIARYAVGEITHFAASESLKEYYSDKSNFPSPDEVKKEIESITYRSVVLKTSQPLSYFY